MVEGVEVAAGDRADCITHPVRARQSASRARLTATAVRVAGRFPLAAGNLVLVAPLLFCLWCDPGDLHHQATDGATAPALVSNLERRRLEKKMATRGRTVQRRAGVGGSRRTPVTRLDPVFSCGPRGLSEVLS